MKALSLKPGTKDVQLIDIEEPKITKPNEVKLKILRVGICGTDREETSGGRADAPEGEDHLIIGHEMLGKVVDTGTDVKKLQKGDFAVITVRRSCGKCESCKAGCTDMCYTGDYKERGIKGLHGFQAEYVVDIEEHILKLPSSLSKIGVLTEPTTVVEKAIDESLRMQVERLPTKKSKEEWLQGRKVLIAGLGPIGLLAAMVLALRGAQILGMDVVDENTARPQILKELGGTYLDGRKYTPDKIHQEHPHIDMILEAAGIPKLDFDLIEALGTNGIYVLTGVPGDGKPLTVDGAKLMKQLVLKNQVLFGSVNAGMLHFEMGINDLETAEKKWGKTIEKIISHVVPIEQYAEVLAKHSADEIKVVLEWEKG